MAWGLAPKAMDEQEKMASRPDVDGSHAANGTYDVFLQEVASKIDQVWQQHRAYALGTLRSSGHKMDTIPMSNKNRTHNKQQMKVAAIFCGHIRSWKHCHSLFVRHIQSHVPLNIAAATYSTIGYNVHDGRGWSESASETIERFKQVCKTSHVLVSESHRDFVPWASGHDAAFRWADQHDRVKSVHLKMPHNHAARAINGAVGMFDCWKRGVDALHALESQHGKHDICMRTRFDTKFIETPKWDEIMSHVDEGSLVAPHFCNFHRDGGCNDQFFLAKRDVWIQAMMIADHLERYVTQAGVTLHPETIFGHHLKDCGIKVVHMPIHFVLLRTSGKQHDLRRAKL